MITLTLSSQPLLSRTAAAYVFFIDHDFDFARLSSTAKELYPHYEQAVKQRGFSGKAGSSLILNGIHNDRAVYLIFLGLGDLKGGYENVEVFRKALGQLVRIAESHKLASFTLDLPNPVRLSLSYERLAQEAATIMYKATYHFNDYITSADRKFTWDKQAIFGVPEANLAEAQKGLDRGLVVADAINKARYWCDLPPSVLTPPALADHARTLAKEYNLKATIFEKKDIIAKNMGGIEGVCRGSVHDPRLVVIEYKSKKPNAQTLAIVGKGVTFDSGGLCIKPAAGMESMKDDMSGAAVVIAAMQVIAQIEPDVNVVAVAPLVENMPSGSAHKPGDIIRTYNGKTIELVDTDAEGRLILADALAYAADVYKPDAMIDFATLTGACAYALGPFYAALLSPNEALTAKVMKAAERSGDKVCRLPFEMGYSPAIASEVADVKNVGSIKYKAGTITASLFLHHFVGDVPWVHLDIAGTAFGVPDLSYYRPGATGYGIRMIADLVTHWDEKL
jgi:leucyl aminopeptidase